MPDSKMPPHRDGRTVYPCETAGCSAETSTLLTVHSDPCGTFCGQAWKCGDDASTSARDGLAG